jgi:hypothetical protein
MFSRFKNYIKLFLSNWNATATVVALCLSLIVQTTDILDSSKLFISLYALKKLHVVFKQDGGKVSQSYYSPSWIY